MAFRDSLIVRTLNSQGVKVAKKYVLASSREHFQTYIYSISTDIQLEILVNNAESPEVPLNPH